MQSKTRLALALALTAAMATSALAAPKQTRTRSSAMDAYASVTGPAVIPAPGMGVVRAPYGAPYPYSYNPNEEARYDPAKGFPGGT